MTVGSSTTAASLARLPRATVSESAEGGTARVSPLQLVAAPERPPVRCQLPVRPAVFVCARRADAVSIGTAALPHERALIGLWAIGPRTERRTPRGGRA